MSNFSAQSLIVLGRQPAIGLAELESIYGFNLIQPITGAALLDIDPLKINFKRLGGSVRVSKILAYLDTTDWKHIEKFLVGNVPNCIEDLAQGKFTLGLSAFNLAVSCPQINKTAMTIKKNTKVSVRVVPNKSPALNSAQVLRNKLTTKGSWELLLYRHGRQTILAQTIFVQDIDDYATRDYERPYRDTRVGMLPPKLAQIIVNLAVNRAGFGGNPQKKPDFLSESVVILDPFCGTGVILQEALLMGYSAYGTDINPKMVEYTKQNLQWLVKRYPKIEGRVAIEVADATIYQWPGFSALASEIYLGRPLTKLPGPSQLNKIVNEANAISKKFLANLLNQLKAGQRVALALPAWRVAPQRFRHLPVIDQLTDMGYTQVSFKHTGEQNLIYHRPNQIVGRQLVVLKRL